MKSISLLMTTYNVEDFVDQTIKSILSQTYTDFEFIIVDDGSTDNTVNIINQFKDSRMTLIKLEKNYGVGYANNVGLEHCNGKYLAKVDGDDIYYPTRLQDQLKYLEDNDLDLVGGLIRYFPNNISNYDINKYRGLVKYEEFMNSIKSECDIKDYISHSCIIPHNLFFGKTDMIKSIGYSNNRIGEDFDLLLKLYKKGAKLGKVDKVLVDFRLYSKSTSAVDMKTIIESNINARIENFPEFFNSTKLISIWGAGEYGYQVADILNKKDINVNGFIDTYKCYSKDNFTGEVIGNPYEIDFNNRNTIICSTSPQIVKVLKNKGCAPNMDFLIF